MKDYKNLKSNGGDTLNPEIESDVCSIMDALCDDLNTPVALSHIFDLVRIVNLAKEGSLKLSDRDLAQLKEVFEEVVVNVLGIIDDSSSSDEKTLDGLMEMILEVRKDAKSRKDYATSDLIRDRLKALGISIKDGKEGTEWSRD